MKIIKNNIQFETLKNYFLIAERNLLKNEKQKPQIEEDCLALAYGLYVLEPKKAVKIFDKLKTARMISIFLIAQNKTI